MNIMLFQGVFNFGNRHLGVQKFKPRAERDRQMEIQRKGRLVLVPCPLEAHMTPMLQLGSILHSKGFSITVMHTGFNSPDSRNHPDFSFHTLSGNLTKEDVSKGVLLQEIINDVSITEFEEHLAGMMKLEEPNDRVLGIIHDFVMHFPEIIASNLKLPSFVFLASSASFLYTTLALPWLHEQGYIPVKDSVLEELVPELYPLRFKDLPIAVNSFELAIPSLVNSSDTRSKTSGFILNTSDYLEHTALSKLQQGHRVPVFSVGPLHKFSSAGSTSLINSNQYCIKWLDTQAPNSVIYASIESQEKMDKQEVVETVCGLANSGQPFLLVVRPGSISGADKFWSERLPDGVVENILERGCIVYWAPQKEVLAHNAVGGFWSDCGWSACLESLSEGVPMICRPLAAYQKVNSRYLVFEWKVGIELEQVLERENIATAVRRLFVEKEGKEIRQRAIEMKEKIRDCVEESGSSYKSLNALVEFLPSSSSKCQGPNTSSG